MTTEAAMTVYVVTFDPGYGDPCYPKGVFDSRDSATAAIAGWDWRNDSGYAYTIEQFTLNASEPGYGV